ncbi:sensor domain-containing protein [Streptomyces sp. NPDC001436]
MLLAPVRGRVWRELLYLLVGLPLSTLYFGLAVAGLSAGAGLLLTFVGVPVLAGVLAMCRGFGHVERARVRGLLRVPVGDPAPVRPAKRPLPAGEPAPVRAGKPAAGGPAPKHGPAVGAPSTVRAAKPEVAAGEPSAGYAAEPGVPAGDPAPGYAAEPGSAAGAPSTVRAAKPEVAAGGPSAGYAAKAGEPVGGPSPDPAARHGVAAAGVGALLKSGSAWRHVLYSVVHFPWAVFSFCLALTLWSYGWSMLLYPLWFWVFPAFTDRPGLQLFQNGDYTFYLDSPLAIGAASALGLGFTLLTPWVVRGLVTVDRVMVTGLLGPSRLDERVSALESGRGVAADTAAADLRRIERDLHDGAQARLAALAVDLGLAKEKLAEDPRAAARLVDEAHGEVKIALQELRDLARGIHPAVLTDRGLDAALSSVAARCAVPVRVQVDLPDRPAPAVEGIAYATVSELLEDVGRHTGARSARVDVWRSGGRLRIRVADDGRGSGAPAGLAERLDAVDGVLAVDSVDGRGTRVTAELPWRARHA